MSYLTDIYLKLRALLDDYAEQRFIMTLGCGIVTSILTWNGKITSETYGVVTLGTVGVFITAAVYEKVKAGQQAPPSA